MRIAKEGYPLILTGAALTSVAAVAGWKLAGGALGLATLAIAGFFRDPERSIPDGEGLVVSPADGKVVSIADVSGDSRFADASTRVSIFLSPLDVHINRMPVGGRIDDVQYRPGKFLAAYKEEASEKNEQNALKGVDEKGRLFGVVQIAGVLARRIVCRAKPGDVLRRGDRFGLIMFGSRTDLYLPRGCRLEINEGQRVKGGETILGRFV
ncbi:MAG: phosphatidylserine decarboxylase family protein [Candidatus Binatia bacterium]